MQNFAFFVQFRRYLRSTNRFYSQKKCYFGNRKMNVTKEVYVLDHVRYIYLQFCL